MTDKNDALFLVRLPFGQKTISYEEVPELIAMAKSPDYDAEKASEHEAVMLALDVCQEEGPLRAAVQAGEVEVLDKSFHRMTQPFNGRLKDTVLTVQALREYVESIKGFLEVEDAPEPQAVTPSPVPLVQAYAEQLANRRAANCYDIHEAAQAIALQLGLNEYNAQKLLDDMGQAAFDGALVVRSPRGHDQYAPTSPPKTTYGFDSLTTPDDVNQWATERRFTWRWLSEPKDEASSPASNSESFPWPRVMHGQRVWTLSEAIDEIARALELHSSQRDRLMAQAVKDASAGVLVLRDLYAGGIMKRGDHMSELLDYVFSRDMNAWLDLIDAPFPYRLPEAEPAQEPQPTTPSRAPVETASASDGAEPATGKKWTSEKLNELKSYRDKHGTKKAAEYFNISQQLIRRKLPSEKPQPKGHSVFTHRIK